MPRAFKANVLKTSMPANQMFLNRQCSQIVFKLYGNVLTGKVLNREIHCSILLFSTPIVLTPESLKLPNRNV